MRLLRQRFGNEVDVHVERRVAAASLDQLELAPGAARAHGKLGARPGCLTADRGEIITK